MRPTYCVTRRDTPHVVLFSAGDLATIAESLGAQPNPEALTVYVPVDGFARDLTEDERRRLVELMAR
jgi:hypothetical protein